MKRPERYPGESVILSWMAAFGLICTFVLANVTALLVFKGMTGGAVLAGVGTWFWAYFVYLAWRDSEGNLR